MDSFRRAGEVMTNKSIPGGGPKQVLVVAGRTGVWYNGAEMIF